MWIGNNKETRGLGVSQRHDAFLQWWMRHEQPLKPTCPASLAPPASAQNSRCRENHMTIVLARIPNTIWTTILAMKNPGP